MISTIHDGDSPEGRPATDAEIEQVLGAMQTPDGTSFLDLYRECAELDAADGADQRAPSPAAPFTPAWFCPNADLTLMWGLLHGVVYGWQLRYRGRLIDTLVGFPVGAPPNGEPEARAWADTVAGPQQWIARPARSGANHTHANPDDVCPVGGAK